MAESSNIPEIACCICGVLGRDLPASCTKKLHKVCKGCFGAYSLAFVRVGADSICPDFDCDGSIECKEDKKDNKNDAAPRPVKLITVKPSDVDYKKVSDIFMNTMKGYHAAVEKIFRIENDALRGIYEACRDRIKKQRGDANEQILFHGTSRAASGGIAREGFDLRRVGKAHGAVYGPGVYFATDAITSHGYTKEDTKHDRCMLLCSVIIGDSKKGDSYDGKSFFVVNREQQILPTHVIYYNCDS